MRWFAIVACVIVMSAVVTHVHAQADNAGYSLTLAATPAGGEVPRGATITYTIHHSLPKTDPVYVTYRLITPLGTTFVSARAVSGATVSAEVVSPAPEGTSPVGQRDVFVDASPTALEGSIIVTVRVEDTWQGPITAQAFFVGTGFGQGSTISQSVALGDGVPGQLVAHRFLDLNGNRVLDPEDFPMSCGVYVYTPQITARRIPDDVAHPADPRLPLVTFGATDDTGTARINLLPGRYAVYFFGCQARTAPPGLTSATNVVADPPLTSVLSASGASKYDVQLIDVASTQLTDLVYAEQPAGPGAPPTDLRRDGLTLTWTDNADREGGYRIESAPRGGALATYDLPADSTRFVLPNDVFQCGTENDVMITVAAVDANGGVSVPASLEARPAIECAFPAVLAPNTGAGRQSTANPWPMLSAMLAITGAVAVAGGVLTRRLRRTAAHTAERKGAIPRPGF